MTGKKWIKLLALFVGLPLRYERKIIKKKQRKVINKNLNKLILILNLIINLYYKYIFMCINFIQKLKQSI